MADEQSKIAAEQVPIYNKALETQLGTSSSSSSGAAGEGMSRTTSTATEIHAPQPPASNPGADDPTAGIPEGAGGLSSTAHIESPVPNHEQGLLSTVKNMFGFGAKTEEMKAEDKEPAENATTVDSSSLLAGSAVASTGAGAAVLGSSELGSTSAVPGAASTTQSNLPVSGSGKGTYLDYQQSANTTDSAFPSSQTLPIRSTPGGQLPSDNTSSSTASASASAAAATKTDTTSQATESIDRTSGSGASTTNDSSNNNKMEEAADSSTKERDPPKEHKPPQPADGAPSKSKGIENRDAIPTAGGKRLGEENWGESKIVPDDPKPASDSSKGVSSKEGQPTDQVKDNTAKNTGGATGGPQSSGNSAGAGGEGEGKEKLVDKIKDKLHMGKK